MMFPIACAIDLSTTKRCGVVLPVHYGDWRKQTG